MQNDTSSRVLVPRSTEAIPQARRRGVWAWLRARFTPPDPRTYITPGEQVIICTRRHWIYPLRAAFAGTMMSALIGLVIVVPLPLTIYLLFATAGVGHTAWIFWCVLRWRVEQIAITSTQLIWVHGIITTNVDVTPLEQITDVRLRRNIPGRILGFGTLFLTTAGQLPQQRLDYLPTPTRVYRATLR